MKHGILKIQEDNTAILYYGGKRLKFNPVATKVMTSILEKTYICKDKYINLNEISSELGVPTQYVLEFVQELIQKGILSGELKHHFLIVFDEISKKIKVAREGSLLYIEWLITSLCQCRCIYCRHEKYKLGANPELSTEEALNVIKQMADMGVVYVTLSGGEPLIRKDIFKIINELYQHDIEIRLDTNGLLLDEKTIAQLAKFRDLLTLSVSLDSSIPEINEIIRVCPPEGTQKIMKGIEEVKAKK